MSAQWTVGYGKGIIGPSCPSASGCIVSESVAARIGPVPIYHYLVTADHPKQSDCSRVIAIVPSDSRAEGMPEAKATAERIVACVTACTGINPEAVPKLLTACEYVFDLILTAPDLHHDPDGDRDRALTLLRDTLKLAKGIRP